VTGLCFAGRTRLLRERERKPRTDRRPGILEHRNNRRTASMLTTPEPKVQEQPVAFDEIFPNVSAR
jgi:hypothetical protein